MSHDAFIVIGTSVARHLASPGAGNARGIERGMIGKTSIARYVRPC